MNKIGLRVICVPVLAFLFTYCSAQQTLYVAANSGLTLRKTASTAGEKLDLLPWGTAVLAQHIEYATDRMWAEVQVNGKTGYAALDYLTPIKIGRAHV